MRTLSAILLLVAASVMLNPGPGVVASKADQKCTDCHTDIQTLLGRAGYIHPAVERGGCNPCHTSHGPGQTPRLLNNSFPAGMYTTAVSDSFALCWDCHDMDMIAIEKTTTVTGFRNGEMNLHFVHISGDRGRNCTVCHNVHAAGNAHLVNDAVRYGNWNMKMNFIVQEQGGSCAPGCHGVKEYKR